jgi:hypothetical protein
MAVTSIQERILRNIDRRLLASFMWVVGASAIVAIVAAVAAHLLAGRNAGCFLSLCNGFNWPQTIADRVSALLLAAISTKYLTAYRFEIWSRGKSQGHTWAKHSKLAITATT